MTHKLVLTTCPDLPTAHLIAEGLIEQRLAACVNILPAMVSIYRWQDKVEQSQECQLFIKTLESKWSELESYIQTTHPYDVPELIALDISAGAEKYMQWIATEVE